MLLPIDSESYPAASCLTENTTTQRCDICDLCDFYHFLNAEIRGICGEIS